MQRNYVGGGSLVGTPLASLAFTPRDPRCSARCFARKLVHASQRYGELVLAS